MIEKIKILIEKYGMNFSKIERQLGFANGSLAKSDDKIQARRLKLLARMFDKSMEYLMSDDSTDDVVRMLSLMGYEICDDANPDVYYEDSFNNHGSFMWLFRDQDETVTICRRDPDDPDIFIFEISITIEEFRKMEGMDFKDIQDFLYKKSQICADNKDNKIMSLYSNLNVNGQKKALEYLKDLYDTGKYKKSVTDSLSLKEA